MCKVSLKIYFPTTEASTKLKLKKLLSTKPEKYRILMMNKLEEPMKENKKKWR